MVGKRNHQRVGHPAEPLGALVSRYFLKGNSPGAATSPERLERHGMEPTPGLRFVPPIGIWALPEIHPRQVYLGCLPDHTPIDRISSIAWPPHLFCVFMLVVLFPPAVSARGLY
jgi:hypothetical protein